MEQKFTAVGMGGGGAALQRASEVARAVVIVMYNVCGAHTHTHTV